LKLNADFNGILIRDELHNVGPSEFSLEHDTIMDDGFSIYTGVNKTGEELVLGTDYELLGEDTRLSSQTNGKRVYTKVRVLNEDYHGTNLYITYKTVGDYAVAEDINAAVEKVRTPQIKADLTNPDMVPTWPFVLNHTKNHVIEFPPLMSAQAVFAYGNYLYIALSRINSSLSTISTIFKVDSTTFEVVNTTTLPHEVVEMDGGSRGLICAGPTISLLDINTLQKKSTTLGSDVGVFYIDGWDIYAVRFPNSYRLITVENGALKYQGSYTISEASEITALTSVYINLAEGSRLVVGTEDGKLMSLKYPPIPSQTINIYHPPKKLIDAGPSAIVAYCKDNYVRCYGPNLTDSTDYVNFSCSGQLEYDYGRESFYLLEGTTLRRKATKSSTIIAETQVATDTDDPTPIKMYCYSDDIYVVNSTMIEVYDAENLSLKRRGNYRDTWTCGVREARAVCCDDKYVYVGVEPSAIIKIDAYTKEPVLRVDINPYDQFPTYGPIYMFRLGNYLFVNNYLGQIIKYDTETLTEVGRYQSYDMVGLTADYDYLYCLKVDPIRLIIIDPTTMEEIQSTDLWTKVSEILDNTPLIVCGKDKLVFEGRVGGDWPLIWISRGYLPPYIQRSIIVSDFSAGVYPTGTIFTQDERFFSISRTTNQTTIERVAAYGKTEMLTFYSNGFSNPLATTDGSYVYFVGRRNDPPALIVIKYDPIKNKIMKKTVQGNLEHKAVASNGRQLIILCKDKDSDQVKLLFLNTRMEE
jgi:hypothetical protein